MSKPAPPKESPRTSCSPPAKHRKTWPIRAMSLDAGHSGDFLDLMAALAPCVLGYGEIGARLADAAGDTPYADWIATYAGAEYQGTLPRGRCS